MRLKKTLDLKDVFCISSGAMISSGIFILPGLAFANVGPAVFVSYLLAGIMAMLGVTAVIELSTAMPKAGGDYYFIERSMGPLPGTISGFLSWSALSFKSAFAVLGMSEVVHAIFGIPLIGTSIVITLLFVVLNIIGVKEAAWLEVFLVFGLIFILVLYICFGLSKVDVSRLDPFIAKDKSTYSILTVSGMVFVSFGGLLKISSVSEEVVNPVRNIPLGIISSVTVVTILYTLILIVTVGTLDASKLSNSLTPLADAANNFYGPHGFMLITAAAIFAFVTTANAGIMAASRYPLALSRDKLIPSFISKVHRHFKTPAISICITGIFMILVLFFDLETLVKAASSVILTSYVLSNLSVIILRESHIRNYRPSFKAPFYPWLQIASVIIFSGMIISMGVKAMASLAIIPIAILLYLIYGRLAEREFALMHLVERITNRKLTEHTLEDELREIIQQRDDIIKDEFDYLVEEAPVLIIDRRTKLKPLLRIISQTLASDINIEEGEMYDMLCSREDESSTAITPSVAVPHIIIEGANLFQLQLIKCTKGIHFSNVAPNVKAVFVLVGSRDLRNRHLKTLTAIAQVIQDKRFDHGWEVAVNEQQIRDVILLAKRQRVN